MKIRDTLRGCTVGRMQSVGYMQIIPLLSEAQDEDVGCPDDLEVQTHGYGSMGFSNPTDKPVIVPLNAAYVINKSAQNHAMMKAGIVGKKGSKIFNDAACIQQTQGGLIPKGRYDLRILPYALREVAISRRGNTNCGKIWPEIAEFNSSMGLEKSIGGHLEVFLEAFDKQLGEFVAEFEVVPHQVGAIILVDGSIVGVERAPSYAYWKSVWPALIRECYGSLAIYVQKTKEKKGKTPPVTRVPLPKKVASLDELSSELAKVCAKEDQKVRDIVNDLIDREFVSKREDGGSGLDTDVVDNEQFIGQVVKKGDRVVYASFVTKKRYADNRVWYEAAPFQI
jgi:hypothetical protein